MRRQTTQRQVKTRPDLILTSSWMIRRMTRQRIAGSEKQEQRLMQNGPSWKTRTHGIYPQQDRKRKSNQKRLNIRKLLLGTLMALCHIKASELKAAKKQFKGIVVFRGDNVRDQIG